MRDEALPPLSDRWQLPHATAPPFFARAWVGSGEHAEKHTQKKHDAVPQQSQAQRHTRMAHTLAWRMQWPPCMRWLMSVMLMVVVVALVAAAAAAAVDAAWGARDAWSGCVVDAAVFDQASSFNGDLSSWDVSSVTNMNSSA